MTTKRTLYEAHMPTWIKASIWEIQQGTRPGGYRLLGETFAKSSDFPEDVDEKFTDAEWDALAWGDWGEGYHLKEGVNATQILQRILASERHPKGDGDLLRQIPARRRAEFLCGVIKGLADN